MPWRRKAERELGNSRWPQMRAVFQAFVPRESLQVPTAWGHPIQSSDSCWIFPHYRHGIELIQRRPTSSLSSCGIRGGGGGSLLAQVTGHPSPILLIVMRDISWHESCEADRMRTSIGISVQLCHAQRCSGWRWNPTEGEKGILFAQ